MRNMIYRYCLVSPMPLHICRDNDRDFTVEAAEDPSTHSGYWNPRVNLLATCKEVRSEATPLLYSLNDFSSRFVREWVIFLKRIGPSIQHLRQVSLFSAPSSSNDVDAIFKLLMEAKSLQTLTLDGSFRDKVFEDPADMVAALLPFLQKIHSHREVGRKNKAAIDIVELLPAELRGNDEFNEEDARALAKYRSEVKRLLQEALK